MALPTLLPTDRSTCNVKVCSFPIKTCGKSAWIPTSLETQASKEMELLRADSDARSYSIATCIFEVALTTVPRKPLTCRKMAVSSILMKSGGRDGGAASIAAFSHWKYAAACKAKKKRTRNWGRQAAETYLVAEPSRTAALKLGPAL
ncbi:MAG: hypothetical protein OIF58_07840 [Cohaesibacter sp.]|nr:hypothetical protein [Cohaesibacter sp.]